MKPVRYDPEARAEFLDAVRWYARRNVVAAIRFDERVSRAEASIREASHQWPLHSGVIRELHVATVFRNDASLQPSPRAAAIVVGRDASAVDANSRATVPP